MPKHNPDIAVFGETNFRNERRRFGIKQDDRRRHMYVVGKTGVGKSVMLENLINFDVTNGHGLAVVDPHGELAEKVIDFIPNNRINDVIYLNPADIDYPIAFNVLEKVEPKYRYLVASGLIGVFKKIWADSWGPRLEYLLRNALLALLDYPDSTLLGVNRMLVDNDYRKKVVAKIQDPVVKAFWLNEFTKYNQQFLVEAISPIQNKVGQFLSTSIIRNIVGQVKSTINIRKAMDENKIIILNLSKGRIGEDASSLLGAMFITKIQLAAMSRVDIPEEERNDFYLYVDEFQNFATESFANILSEARKYRLNLIIAHQYIEQLGEIVKPAVFGNVGTLVIFRVGAMDAEELVMEFTPTFTEEDLVNLPKYNVYLKLMIDGVSSDPFSATTLPPVAKSTGNIEQIIINSRERYAKSREEVEEKIARWSGVETEAMLLRAEKDLKEKQTEGESDEKPSDGGAIEKSIDFLRNYRKKIMPVEEAEIMEEKAEEKAEEKVEEKVVKKEVLSEKKAESDAKPAYEDIVKCDWCDQRTRINFKPDPSKPVLCKECLKDYRRMQAKGIEPPKKLNKNAPTTSPAPRKIDEPKAVVENKLSLSAVMKQKPASFNATRNSHSGAKVVRPEATAAIKPRPVVAEKKPKETELKAGEEVNL
ncbi:MAG TPA: type IV secretion system DNA-binding domain-containing protein [Candidatus Bipolaricaulota bacterium]|nr:type IV secretion system DNA-binding domain-containing protein [Candidatus Bipolaricaulota bacterium]